MSARAAPGGLLRAAIAVEARKARSAHVMLWTTVLLVAGIGVLALGILAAVAAGEEQVIAKLGPLAGVGGWAGLVGIVVQVTAAGGLAAFGVALSWMFGREFADGTVAALFAMPVPRAAIALGKLIVYVIWAVGVAVLPGSARSRIPASVRNSDMSGSAAPRSNRTTSRSTSSPSTVRSSPSRCSGE